MSAKSADQALIRSFQSDVAAIREAPPPHAAMSTVHVLIAFMVVVALLLTFGQIDRVIASSQGEIELLAPPQVYQALDQSIIKSINVREGMKVSKGEVMATLDPTFAQADVTQLKQQVASLNAQILRDDAELAGHVPNFPTTSDADQLHYNDLQQKLYFDRDAQYRAQIKNYDEQIKQTEATIAKTHNDIDRYGERADIADKIEAMRSKLLASGAGSLLNQLQSKDNNIELRRQVENLTNSLKEAEAQASALRATRDAFTQQWRATTSQDLVTSQNNRDQARAQLEKALRHQDLVNIEALDDSIILSIAKLSVGSVLQPGDRFITAMPANQPVQATIHVLSRDVGFIRVGDPVVMKVDAFNFSEHGTVDGKVLWISEGAFWTNEQTNQPTEAYYKVGVSIDKVNFRNVPDNVRLMPGMTLSADIRVGKRSMGRYFLDAMFSSVSSAMREP